MGLSDPTRRPEEPVTAGIPLGEGESAPRPGTTHDPALWHLRALAARFPDVRELYDLIIVQENEL